MQIKSVSTIQYAGCQKGINPSSWPPMLLLDIQHTVIQKKQNKERRKQAQTHTHTLREKEHTNQPSNGTTGAQQTRNISGRICNTIEIHTGIKFVGYVNKF